jgi:hypothetical protein
MAKRERSTAYRSRPKATTGTNQNPGNINFNKKMDTVAPNSSLDYYERKLTKSPDFGDKFTHLGKMIIYRYLETQEDEYLLFDTKNKKLVKILISELDKYE